VLQQCGSAAATARRPKGELLLLWLAEKKKKKKKNGQKIQFELPSKCSESQSLPFCVLPNRKLLVPQAQLGARERLAEKGADFLPPIVH